MPGSNPVTKYHVIEVTLAGRIRDGLYDVGGLPGERALATEFRAARITIRSALRRLEQQGLIVRTQRRGTTAVSAKEGGPRRRLLREDLDRFLDRGRKDKRKVLQFGFVAAAPAVAAALEMAAGGSVLRVVRLRSDAASPLTFTEAFVPQRFVAGIERKALERKAFVQVLEESGISIATAEQHISCEAAPPDVSKMLAIAPHGPVLKLIRLIRGQDGSPVQYFVGWYRADRFEVRMRLSRAEDTTKVWVEYH